jgi:NADH-quinone oxidoreductase subunit C
MSWPATTPELGKLGRAILKDAKTLITTADVLFGELTLAGPAGRVVEALTVLRDKHGFRQLIDIAGADYPERERRFDVVYHLLSMTKNQRVRLKVQSVVLTAVASDVCVFPNADWY